MFNNFEAFSPKGKKSFGYAAPADKADVVEPVPRCDLAAENAPQSAGVAVDKKDEPANDLAALPFKERLNWAKKVAEKLASLLAAQDFYAYSVSQMKEEFPVLSAFKAEGIKDITGFVKTTVQGDVTLSFDKLAPAQKNNIFIAYLLFYILTGGKYPQECWQAAVKEKQASTCGKLEAVYNSLQTAAKAGGLKRYPQLLEDGLGKMKSEAAAIDLAAVMPQEEAVGKVKIFEMLWEVFIAKYPNYNIKAWLSKLSDFAQKEYKKREMLPLSLNNKGDCEFAEAGGDTEIYAVSYQGQLDKPGHKYCEDCAYVRFFTDDAWLAVSADGVGSCGHSNVGSQYACEKLAETIEDYLISKRGALGIKKESAHEVLKKLKKITKPPKKEIEEISRREWANFMYFLRFELASKLYGNWYDAVSTCNAYENDPQAKEGDFTCTLQFAFGCKQFIACGRVGDGTFFVRKKEKKGSGGNFGGMLLNDGISGVTQTSVYTIAVLKNNPTALQVDFFNPDEVTDLLISSDGASAELGDSVPELCNRVSKLRELPFEERQKVLSALAMRCSDYNFTRGGSGDDCTIVSISMHMPQEKQFADNKKAKKSSAVKVSKANPE